LKALPSLAPAPGGAALIGVHSSIDAAIVAELQQLDAMSPQVAALRDFLGQFALEDGVTHTIEVKSALDRISRSDARSPLTGGDSEGAEGWERL